MSELPHDTEPASGWFPESLIDQFEEAWQSGAVPSLAEFLGQAAAQETPAGRIEPRTLLEELIPIDMEYRWRRADSLSGKDSGSLPRLPVLENYLDRFPVLGGAAALPLELVTEEYRVRRQWGDQPDAWEYVDRFPHLGEQLPTALLQIDRESALERRNAVQRRAASRLDHISDTSTINVSLGDFIRCLVNSGLMTAEDVEAVQRRLPDDRRPTSAAEFAGYLCEQQVLTDYQTGVLSQGSSDYLVLGDYELQEILGSGGMGTVFRARHRRMRRTVALKVLPESQLDSAEAVERFHREVEAAGRVDHPNIVRAFDAREDDGLHYLVMEYVEGEDLARQVRHSGPLSPRQAVDCILQAARGLACAHANGIVHRDVKPSNLLRDGQGVIRVLDLGLARLERPDAGKMRNADRCELTEMGITMGTVGYMAPEQAIDSRQADERADVYGLGCTLYYLLTGQAMFPGRTKMQELIAHREETPPGLRETLPGLPESLDAAYRKMVARRPEDRFQSMESVIAELEQILATGDLPPDEADLGRKQRENPPVNSSDSTDRHGQSISQTDPARQSSPTSKEAGEETTSTSGTAPAPASRQLDLRTILATLGCVLAGGLLVLVAMTWNDRDGRTAAQPVPDAVPADDQASASGASGQLPDEQLSEQIGQALQSLSPGRAGHAAVLALVNQVSDTLAGRGETALVSGAVEGPAGSELGPRVRQIVEQAIQTGPVQLSRRIATKLSGDVWLAGSGKSLAMIVELELRDRDNARIVSFEQRVPLDPASPDPYARLSEIGDLSAHAAVSRELDRLAGRIAEYMESRGENQFVSGSIDGPVDVEVAPLRTGLMQRLAGLGLRQERMHGLKVGADVLLELAPQQSEFLLRINVELRDRNNQLVHSIPSGPVIIH